MNLALLVAPVLLPQVALEDLSGARKREPVDDLQAARRLVARDQGLGVRAQLLVGQGRAGAQDDDGMDTLAPVRVGDADDGALGDRMERLLAAELIDAAAKLIPNLGFF